MMKMTDKHVFFYTEWPSNFYQTCFEWTAFGETHKFFCTEQAFMWAKAMTFGDARMSAEILTPVSKGNTPMWCKNCGRWVQNYDDRKWDELRYGFMRDVNLMKYSQDRALREKLLDSAFAEKTFVEASPYDKIWGIGLGLDTQTSVLDDEKNWKGRNLLGKAITEVRQMILTDGYVEVAKSLMNQEDI